jgi:hypothetical protein
VPEVVEAFAVLSLFSFEPLVVPVQAAYRTETTRTKNNVFIEVVFGFSK